MARLRGGEWTYEPGCDAIFDLMLGPTDAPGELTVEQLAVAWEFERAGMMADCRRNPNPAWRPWGWWAFDQHEPKPEGQIAEMLRLLELGELDEAEVRAVEQRARDALKAADWADHVEQVGAVTTAPASAREGMRERRARDREGWRRVLKAVEGAL
jgi:hypothetical protein